MNILLKKSTSEMLEPACPPVFGTIGNSEIVIFLKMRKPLHAHCK